MAGKDNLISLADRATDEQREIARLGGFKSQEVQRKKKTTKQIIEAIFASKAPDHLIQKLQKEFPDVEIKTIEDLVNMAMMRQTVKGNVQAYNAILDRKEGKPKQEIINTGSSDVETALNLLKNELSKPIQNRQQKDNPNPDSTRDI